MTPTTPDIPHNGARLVTSPIPMSVDERGLMMTEWELSEEEKDLLFNGGVVRIWADKNSILAEVATPLFFNERES